MRTVWQFPIPAMGDQVFFLDVPIGGKPINVDYNGKGEPSIYLDVDPGLKTEKRRFMFAGTGGTVPDAAHYIGSFAVTTLLGRLVFHVFEVELVS